MNDATTFMQTQHVKTAEAGLGDWVAGQVKADDFFGNQPVDIQRQVADELLSSRDEMIKNVTEDRIASGENPADARIAARLGTDGINETLLVHAKNKVMSGILSGRIDAGGKEASGGGETEASAGVTGNTKPSLGRIRPTGSAAGRSGSRAERVSQGHPGGAYQPETLEEAMDRPGDTVRYKEPEF